MLQLGDISVKLNIFFKFQSLITWYHEHVFMVQGFRLMCHITQDFGDIMLMINGLSTCHIISTGPDMSDEFQDFKFDNEFL